MPRRTPTTELQAEEVSVGSPLRRSTRHAASGTSTPGAIHTRRSSETESVTPARVTRSRRASQSEDNKEAHSIKEKKALKLLEEPVAVATPGYPKRRTSTSSESNDTGQKISDVPVKPRGRRRSTEMISVEGEDKHTVAKPKTRRSSITESIEDLENPKTVPSKSSTRRSSVTSVEEPSNEKPAPVKRRRSSVTELTNTEPSSTVANNSENLDAKKPIRSRSRGSVEPEEISNLSKTRRSTEIIDANLDIVPKAKTTRSRRGSSEELENPSSRGTRTRRVSFTENVVNMEPIKEVEIDKDDNEEPKTSAVKKTSDKIKKPRTESVSHLEPIEEVEVKATNTGVKRSRRRVISMKIEETPSVKPEDRALKKADRNTHDSDTIAVVDDTSGHLENITASEESAENTIPETIILDATAGVPGTSENLECIKLSESTPQKNSLGSPSRRTDDQPETPHSNEKQGIRKSPRINKTLIAAQNVSPKEDLPPEVGLPKSQTSNIYKTTINKSTVVLLEKYEATSPKVCEQTVTEVSSSVYPIVCLERFGCAPLESKVSSTTDGIGGSFEFHMNISVPNSTVSSQESIEKDANTKEVLNVSTESCASNKENMDTNSKHQENVSVKQASYVEEPMEVDECPSYIQESNINTVFENSTLKVDESSTEVEYITKADISGEVTILNEIIDLPGVSEKQATTSGVISEKNTASIELTYEKKAAQNELVNKTSELSNERLKLVLNDWNDSGSIDEENNTELEKETQVSENEKSLEDTKCKDSTSLPTEPRRSLSKVTLRKSSSPLILRSIRKSKSTVLKEDDLSENDTEKSQNENETSRKTKRSLSPIPKSANNSLQQNTLENVNSEAGTCSSNDSKTALETGHSQRTSIHEIEEESLKQHESNNTFEIFEVSTECGEVPQSDKTPADYEFSLSSDEEVNHSNVNKSDGVSFGVISNSKRLNSFTDEYKKSSPPKKIKRDESSPPKTSNSESVGEMEISEKSQISPQSSTNISIQFSTTEIDATDYAPTNQTSELQNDSLLSDSKDVTSQKEKDEKISSHVAVTSSEENIIPDTQCQKNIDGGNSESLQSIEIQKRNMFDVCNETCNNRENEKGTCLVKDENESKSLKSVGAEKNTLTSKIIEGLKQAAHTSKDGNTARVNQDLSNQLEEELKETDDQTEKPETEDLEDALIQPEEKLATTPDKTDTEEIKESLYFVEADKSLDVDTEDITGSVRSVTLIQTDQTKEFANKTETKVIEAVKINVNALISPEKESAETPDKIATKEINDSEYSFEADKSFDVNTEESLCNTKNRSNSTQSSTPETKHKGELSESESVFDEVFLHSSPDTSVKSGLEETKSAKENVSTEPISIKKNESLKVVSDSKKSSISKNNSKHFDEDELIPKVDNSVTSTDEAKPKETFLKYKTSLEEFAGSKMDLFLKNKLKDLEENDSSDHDSDRGAYSEFIDGMAEEGEEETPSEDSNEIVDEGESVGFSSDESKHGDSDYENDSFVCEDEEQELLSGNEDVDIEKEEEKIEKKRSTRHKRDVNEDDSSFNAKTSKWSRIVAASDSSDSEAVEVIPSNNDTQESGTKNCSEIVQETFVESAVVDIKDQSVPETRKRSSLSLQENINVTEINETALGRRINSLVESFYNTIKSKGEIQLNLSLDFEQSESSENEKKEVGTSKVIVISDIPLSPVKRTDSVELHNNKHIEELNESEEGPEKMKLSITLDEEDMECLEPEKHSKRRLSRSLENVSIENKKKRKRRQTDNEKKQLLKGLKYTSKQSIKKNTTKQNKDLALENLRTTTFSLMNQLVTDVKKREKRQIKPSTAAANSWIEIKEVLKPSKTNTETPKQDVKPAVKHHPKDFKNQMLNDKTRVKRVDSRVLLKKKLGRF